jgi:hypothetical protein
MSYVKAVLAVALVVLVAACGHIHPAGVAFEPNPPPPPGFRAVCSSVPLPFNAYMTGCAPAGGAEEAVVVRAKG